MATLNIAAILLQPGGAPLAATRVQAVTFTPLGAASVAGEAFTNSAGAVQIALLNLPDAPYQPRVRLRAVLGGVAVALSDAPAAATATGVDFGLVVVATRPLFRMGSTDFYGVPQSLFASLSGAGTGGVGATGATGATGDGDGASAVGGTGGLTDGSEDALGSIQPVTSSAELLSTMAALDATRSDLAAAQAALTAQGIVKLEDALANIGSQVASAGNALEGTGYRLGDVSVEMKYVAPQSGFAQFVTKADVASLSGSGAGAYVSTATFDVAKAPPPVPGTSSGASLSVPSLVGYTEAPARRKLESLGLAAEVSFEVVPAAQGLEASQAGRVLRQVPAAGKLITRDSAVKIFIGKQG